MSADNNNIYKVCALALCDEVDKNSKYIEYRLLNKKLVQPYLLLENGKYTAFFDNILSLVVDNIRRSYPNKFTRLSLCNITKSKALFCATIWFTKTSILITNGVVPITTKVRRKYRQRIDRLIHNLLLSTTWLFNDEYMSRSIANSKLDCESFYGLAHHLATMAGDMFPQVSTVQQARRIWAMYIVLLDLESKKRGVIYKFKGLSERAKAVVVSLLWPYVMFINDFNGLAKESASINKRVTAVKVTAIGTLINKAVVVINQS